MSKQAIYAGLKPILEAVTAIRGDKSVMTVKYVGVWRNNLQMEREEIPNQFPAIYIEFLPSNFMELSKGVQSYDLTTRLHICFESYKDEDLDVLELVDAVYRDTQFTQFGYSNKLKRRNEEQDFNHPNVQDYIQDYDCGKIMAYIADKRATTEATVDTIVVTPEITNNID
jgi:hypothetical protein